MLRNGLLRYRLHTCPSLCCNSCSKCYAMDCFGTYFTHVQTCDVTRVQSATEWTASVQTLHMSKTCDVTRVQSATQYDCFGANFTHCFGVRLSVFGFRFSAFGFWPSACGFRFSSFGFRLPASCFVCTTSAFGFRLSSPGSPTPYVSPAHVSVSMFVFGGVFCLTSQLAFVM